MILLIFFRELIVDLVSPSVLDLQDGVFGRINISDNPMNIFITSHCVGNNSSREKVCIFPPRGDSPVRNEEKSQFAVSPLSRPVLDTCFHLSSR